MTGPLWAHLIAARVAPDFFIRRFFFPHLLVPSLYAPRLRLLCNPVGTWVRITAYGVLAALERFNDRRLGEYEPGIRHVLDPQEYIERVAGRLILLTDNGGLTLGTDQQATKTA